MKKSFFENLDVIGLGLIFAFVLCLIRGIGLAESIVHLCFAVCVIVFALTVDDIDFKYRNYRKLINWKEWAGCGMVVFADLAFWYLALSETMVWLWVWTAICVICSAGAFCWFLFMYVPSVMKSEELDLYDRAKFASRIKKAKDVDAVKKILAHFLRYHSKNDNYAAGSDYTKPFDSIDYRTLNQVKLDNDKEAQVLAGIIDEYETILAKKIIAERNK